MPTKLEKPLSTKLYTSWEKFQLNENSLYIYGTSVEERSTHPEDWEKNADNTQFISVTSDENGGGVFSSCQFKYNGEEKEIK